MSTKIKTISDGTTDYDVSKDADLTMIKTNRSPDVSVKGDGASKAGVHMTCAISGLKQYEVAWTLTRFCVADKEAKWSVHLGELSPGVYLVTVSEMAGDIASHKLEVATEGIVSVLINLGKINASKDGINQPGTVLNAGAQVHCSLTATDSSGNPTGSPSTKIVTASQQKDWYVSFVPKDLALMSFSGNYSFEAYAATEGTVSRAILI